MIEKKSTAMRARIPVFKSTQGLCLAGIMTALSIVLGKFLQIPNPFMDFVRISFENLPIILTGMTLGPIAAAIVGVVADLIGCVLYGYSINPIITLGAFATGIVSGLVAMLIKKPLVLRVCVSTVASHTIGSVIIKSIGLAAYYGMPYYETVLWRLINYLIVGSAEGILLFLLLKNKALSRKLAEMGGRMNHREAIDYIHSINWTFCKPGLERIGELCEKLGHPERSLKFVHVAGTNGKGSFCAMLSSVLISAGYKVGLYTSPFIKVFNERMQINGENIDNDTLIKITEKVRPIADAMTDKPTEFELITAIAFEYFKECGAQIVILEAGMGGRLDSTNVIDTAVLSVITGVSLDHTAFLGDTVEAIAKEKAGIIKRGTAVLYGGLDNTAREVIKSTADELGTAFIQTDISSLNIKSADLHGTVLDYKDFVDIKIKLLGLYQPQNTALVLESVTALRSYGYSISDNALREGLISARWPARFEILKDSPLLIFDGAHNPEGIDSAVKSIKHYFDGKVFVLTGVLKDKDYRFIAQRLSEVTSRAFTITPDNTRALSAEEYAEILSKYGVTATPCQKISDALNLAIKEAELANVPLLCLGSLYTYTDVIKYLEK